MEFTVHKLSQHITQIADASGVSTFLVEGSERAVLIDTGIGLKGIRETVENQTSKPYTVILTHGHGDHSGGCAAFPEVYIGEADMPLFQGNGMEMRVQYTRFCLDEKEQMTGVHTDYDPERDMIPEPSADKKFKFLEDGMVFDLGGVSVKIIAVPGHTKGSCMMLIPEERTMIYGDSCNINTLVAGDESTTISEYQAALKRVKAEYDDCYDTVLYSHGPAVGPKGALDDNLELCEKILNGTDDHIPMDGIVGPGFLAAKRKDVINRADGKFGNIFYSEKTRR